MKKHTCLSKIFLMSFFLFGTSFVGNSQASLEIPDFDRERYVIKEKSSNPDYPFGVIDSHFNWSGERIFLNIMPETYPEWQQKEWLETIGLMLIGSGLYGNWDVIRDKLSKAAMGTCSSKGVLPKDGEKAFIIECSFVSKDNPKLGTIIIKGGPTLSLKTLESKPMHERM